jgi:hypothetical protein
MTSQSRLATAAMRDRTSHRIRVATVAVGGAAAVASVGMAAALSPNVQQAISRVQTDLVQLQSGGGDGASEFEDDGGSVAPAAPAPAQAPVGGGSVTSGGGS